MSRVSAPIKCLLGVMLFLLLLPTVAVGVLAHSSHASPPPTNHRGGNATHAPPTYFPPPPPPSPCPPPVPVHPSHAAAAFKHEHEQHRPPLQHSLMPWPPSPPLSALLAEAFIPLHPASKLHSVHASTLRRCQGAAAKASGPVVTVSLKEWREGASILILSLIHI